MTVHYKKIWPEYFNEVKNGNKTFEVRENDENYQVGDILVLQEYIAPFTQPIGVKEDYLTGNEVSKEINYVLNGGQWGIDKKMCILGLKPDGIKLKNIDLKGLTLVDELYKLDEERRELTDALLNYLQYPTEPNREHLLEEICDNMQVPISVLGILEIDVPELVEYWNAKHLKKIENRPRKEKI